MRPPPDRAQAPRALAPLVLAVLALATVAAFAYAQRLKREPLILDRVALGQRIAGHHPPFTNAFTPNGDCVLDKGRIRFRITRNDTADVQVIDRAERVVRTLNAARPLKRYTFFTLHWDGRDDAGDVVAAGRYKLRLILHGEDRSLIPGGALRVHEAPPREPRECGRRGGVSAKRRTAP